jgi:hypothetical protein
MKEVAAVSDCSFVPCWMLVVDLLVVLMGMSWDFPRPSLFGVGLFQDGEDHAESVGWVRVVAQVNNETAIGVEPLGGVVDDFGFGCRHGIEGIWHIL